MNFLNLQYFLAVASELNFTKAAQRLYISQQCLSRHIRNLEDECDIALFNRTHPLSLTPAGLSLQKNASEVLEIHTRMIQELTDIKSSVSGEINLGVSITRGKIILPPVLSAYCEKFPNVQIKLAEGSSRHLEQALLTGKIDLFLGFLPHDDINISSIPLYSECFYAVVPKALLHRRFGAEATSIHRRLQESFGLQLLKGIPIISMPPSFKIGSFIQRLAAKEGSESDLFLETTSVDTALALCMQGLGLCITPMAFITEEIKQNTYIYRIDHPDAGYSISASYLKDRYMAKPIFEFISIAQAVMGNQE